MKSLRFISFLFGISVFTATSASASLQTEAPKNVIKDSIAYCADIEPEYRLMGESQNEYLLKCVNEVITAEGYREVASLDH